MLIMCLCASIYIYYIFLKLVPRHLHAQHKQHIRKKFRTKDMFRVMVRFSVRIRVRFRVRIRIG